MQYAIMFITSSLFLKIGYEKYTGKKRNEVVGRLSTLIGLALPILMATFRDITVGRDVSYYILPFFIRAQSYTNFLAYYSHTKLDIGFALIIYCITRVSKDIRTLFFIISSVTVIFSYMGFWNLKKFQKPWIMMLYYYFFAYCNSLSQVRQGMSIALIVFGISLILKYDYKSKGYLKCIGIIILATTIQTGALVGILPMYIIFTIKKGLNLKKAIIPALMIFLIIAFFRNDILVAMFRIAGMINYKYSSYDYLSTFRSNGISDNTTTSLMCLISFIISIIEYININRITSTSETKDTLYGQRSLLMLCITTSGIVLILEIFLSSFRVIMRLILTLQVFWSYALSMTSTLAKKYKGNIVAINSLTLTIVFLYWYQLYINIDMVLTSNYVLAL